MILALLALIALIVGMFRPQTVKCRSRGWVALIYISAFFVFLIVGGLLLPESETSEQEKTNSENAEIVQPANSNYSAGSIAKGEKPSLKKTNTKKSDLYAEEEESVVGQAVEVGHFVYVVTGVSFRKSIGNEFFGETADGVYLLINLSIKNISKETRMLDNSLFTLTDKNRMKYEYAVSASTALELSGYKTLFLKECQPNIVTKGFLVFEVPHPDEYYLHLVGNFWGGKSKKILLK